MPRAPDGSVPLLCALPVSMTCRGHARAATRSASKLQLLLRAHASMQGNSDADSPYPVLDPLPAGRQLVSPFAPRGTQRHEGGQPGASEDGGEARRRMAPMASRLSSAQPPARMHSRDNGSDEEFLPFEHQRKSSSLRSGSHARETLLASEC